MQALLNPSPLKYGALPFDQFQTADFLPALEVAIKDAYVELERWKKERSAAFKDVIVSLDDLRETISQISSIFYNLHSAHTNDELEKIAPEISTRLTKFSNDVTLDPIVFARIEECWNTRDKQNLTTEEMMILNKTYKSFVRNGAKLPEAAKTRMRQIDEALAKLSISFSQNVLKATNNFEKFITDKALLDGLPESFLEASSEAAEKKGKKGQWLLTLDYPMIVPVLTYAKNRELRREMFLAHSSKAFSGDLDNKPHILEVVKLRFERANLLGYKTHADYVLEERMADSPDKVKSFLSELNVKAKPHAQREIAKLSKLALELDGIKQLEKWDSSYYSEILKKREIGFDEEVLRPFFSLEKVIAGIFQVTQKLYGLNYKELSDLPVYHEDVKVYEVTDKNGFVGLFYMDFFPRASKRGGAWMTSFVDQGISRGESRRPHVAIVCNFTKPTKTKPSLLTLNEVTTLYHEFGHALHGLLSKCKYTSLSGTNVYWDFVELPSQIMENWVHEKDCLDLFAAHYETGEKISIDLIEKIKKSGSFLEGLATMRQLTFATLDMHWHSQDPKAFADVLKVEAEATKELSFLPDVPGTSISCSFSHIFAGGYSAGYYSYKWAEVLDADAFEYFKEKGIFNPEVAKLFRENILERGGTEHPMNLYKKFRGKEPNVDALLRRAGLIN
jgi:Zn-dependent oligopeptidase